MANSVLCTKCGNLVHGSSTKMKRVTTRLAMHFVCSTYRGIIEEMLDRKEKLCGEVDFVIWETD